MEKTPTPHISAKKNEIAKTVIMPGDPIRAKIMAKKFLQDYNVVSKVRNNYCYTGKYKNKLVSIMSSGMGPASMGIYSYELYNFYLVENIIRVGTIGSLNNLAKIGDIVIAQQAITDTNYNEMYKDKKLNYLPCSKKLLKLAKAVIKKKDYTCFLGNIFTTDTFYSSKKRDEFILSQNVYGVEMEGASLYSTALAAKKEALCICTVSDEVLSGKTTSSVEREKNFEKMFIIALEIATKI